LRRLAIDEVLNTVRMARADLRATRANRVFCTDEKHIGTENTVMVNTKTRRGGFIQDRRLRTDVLFIRAQSTIRADGFSSAQYRNSATMCGRDLGRYVYEALAVTKLSQSHVNLPS